LCFYAVEKGVKQQDDLLKDYYDIRTHNKDGDQTQLNNVDFWKGAADIMEVSENNCLTCK
jgi:hypothetical protein